MLLSFLTVLIAALPLAVLGGEFPTHNGVVGGVPAGARVYQKVSGTPPGDVVAKAGSLRYVENTGVCGEPLPMKFLLASMLTTRQKRPQACTQLQATRT